MAITKEFTVLVEDRPSMLGKLCRALADNEVNILALQSFPNLGKFVIRLIVDKPDTARMVFNNRQLTFVETNILQAKIQHRPGEIARLASRLGKANININYAYYGLEPLATGSKAHDCSINDLLVQVKTTQRDSIQIGEPCDHLIALKLMPDGGSEEFFNGPGGFVWDLVKNKPMPKNGLYAVRLNKLRELMNLVPTERRVARIKP
jgi:hypothetical protein